MACATTQLHYCSHEPDVHAVEEIASALLAVLVCISYAPHIYLPCAQCFQLLHCVGFVVFMYPPESCKVVEKSVGYHSERNLLPL